MYMPQRLPTALVRGAKMLLRPLSPLLVQMVVTRRCNLTCGYCNEYDDVSPPVPLDTLRRQIDHIADLGTLVLTFTGGEPLIHPELDSAIAHAVERGLVVTSITNGYPITRRWIERLNAARLSFLQLSIDNLEPNEVSQKSLSKIEPKLELLERHAKFGVNINAVLGSSPPEATLELVRRVERLGFYMTVGLMHGPDGQLDPGLAGEKLGELYEHLSARSKKTIFHHLGEGWESTMIREGEAPYACRAGSRYLYVDEFGNVSFCSQRRGEPGTPLLEYGQDALRTAYATNKSCDRSCTIACVRRASAVDRFRARPPSAGPASAGGGRAGSRSLPVVP